jgi:hypothetical protein
MRPAQPTLEAVRELATSSPPSEFPAFCEAVRTWLAEAAGLDPALAAVADLVEALSGTGEPIAEAHLARVASDAADLHGLLGASTLLSLWSGRRTFHCAPRGGPR